MMQNTNIHNINSIKFIRKTKKISILIPLMFVTLVNAQKPIIPAIDEFVGALYDSIAYIPSISVGVVQDGVIVHQVAYGYSDVANKLPAETSTQYYIASTTKSFTALAATILEEKGQLDFNKSIADYFPKIKFPDSIEIDKVTIPDLLGHTSGIDNCADMTFKLAYSGSFTYDEFFDILKQTCGRDKIGTFRYSNFGYNLLNLIFIKELGKTWKEIVQEQVLDPIGMAHTYSSYVNLLENNEVVATPYRALGVNGKDHFEVPKLNKRDDTMHAAGGLYSSVDDVLKWLLIQVNNGELKSKSVISSSALAKAREMRGVIEPDRFGLGKYNVSYGFGWNIGKYKEKELYHHGGGFAGYRTLISYIPKTKSGVVVMINDSQLGNGFTTLLSEFIYDLMENSHSNNNDWKKAYHQSISKMKFESKKYGLDRMHQDYSNRMKRNWDFTVDQSAIIGAYKCKDGNRPLIRIFDKNGSLGIIQGNMEADVEPYIYPNTIRVDMTGIGHMLELELDGDRVTGFNYNNNHYEKL